MSYLKGIGDRVNSIEAKSNFNLLEIDIEKLIPSTNNFYGIREVDELADSIKENGLMHNLVVRKKEDDYGYEILSGERRYHALKKLGYKKAPCQVKVISDLDSEILLIQANSKQRELSHMEKMKGIERLKELYKEKKANGEEVPKGKTRDLIGKDIGLSGVQVGRYIKVSEKLIEPLKEKLEESNITLTQADTLSSLNKEEQQCIYNQISNTDTKISNAEVDILIEGIKQPVSFKKDKELLNEMYWDKELSSNKVLDELKTISKIFSNRVLDELKTLIDHYKTPQVIIKNKYYECILFSQNIKFKEDKMVITLTGFSTANKIRVKYDKVVPVTEIEINTGKITAEKAFKLGDDMYIWFSQYKEA